MARKLTITKILAVVILMSLCVIIIMDMLISDNSRLIKLVKQNISYTESDELIAMDLVSEYPNKELSPDELVAEFQHQLPNVPYDYSLNYDNVTKPKNYKCALFPAIKSLNYYNDYWQTYNRANITIHLFGAYYDERPAAAVGNSTAVVRILAMINQITAPFPTSYCQFWFENDRKPVITNIETYQLIWRPAWGYGVGIYYPYLLTCQVPKVDNVTSTGHERIPKAVTIVENKCDQAKNALKVIYEKPPQKLPFAVCVKGLDFPYADISGRLTEWLEMLRILGVNKVYFHNIAIHPNVRKVLDYYQQQEFVELQPISSVAGLVGLPHLQHWLVKPTLLIKRLNELMPYNECFYRNMYKYDYIGLIDIDEVIMPLGNLTTWHDLVTAAKQNDKMKKCSQGFAAICVRNTYFPYTTDNFTLISPTSEELVPSSDTPSHMFMLNRLYRTNMHQPNGYNTKCLHNTEQALTLHNHYPFSWLKSCRPVDLSNATVQLQHFHDMHPDKNFKELILDRNIERFRNPLIENVTKVLKKLKLI